MPWVGSDINKVWKDCPSKKQLFPIYIQLVKLIFGEEPLHTPRKNRLEWWEISHIDVFGKISRSKVNGMEIDEQFFNYLRRKLRVKKIKPNEHGHIHKASESSKNPFLYPKFIKSFVTNLLLAS